MGEAAAAGVDDGYRILKGKLGTERDRERVEAVRAAPPPTRRFASTPTRPGHPTRRS
jgi:L-alanine-DL-glutamate epimerase-like enolase superfamily enzyme